MTESIKEQLSALIDGELEREPTRFLLSRMANDAPLAATWTRFHLVRSCLRHRQDNLADGNLAERIRIEIEGEPLLGGRRLPSWSRYAAGGAIAASVALLALLAVRPGVAPIGHTDGPALAVAAPAPALPDRPLLRPDLAAQPAAATQGATTLYAGSMDPRLESYLIRHYQAAGGQRSGFAPYVPLVAPNVRKDAQQFVLPGPSATAQPVKPSQERR